MFPTLTSVSLAPASYFAANAEVALMAMAIPAAKLSTVNLRFI
jgi:hypothetical protein